MKNQEYVNLTTGEIVTGCPCLYGRKPAFKRRQEMTQQEIDNIINTYENDKRRIANKADKGRQNYSVRVIDSSRNQSGIHSLPDTP